MLPYWPWWAWLILVAAFVPTCLLGWALGRLNRGAELHHGYYGIALAAVGIPLLAHGHPWLGGVPAALGLWLLWDDALAHSRQARDPHFPTSGPRAVLDRRYSWWHRVAHRWGLI